MELKMNLNETFEMMSNAANDNYANLRKLADINLGIWDQLAGKQMEVMKLCMASGNKQVELAKTTQRPDELFGKQAELVRELGEQLIESNQQVVDILSNSREQYQGWVEASADQVRSQFEQNAPAKTSKAA
jgi:phasin family protein